MVDRVIDGVMVRGVPADMSDDVLRARVGEHKRLQALGTPTQQIRRQLAEQTGPVQTGLIAASQFLAERGVPGFDKIPEGISAALQEESPISSFIGGAALPVLSSFLVPGAGLTGIASQAGVQGGLEALREGSTPGSVAFTAGLAGGGNRLVHQALQHPGC